MSNRFGALGRVEQPGRGDSPTEDRNKAIEQAELTAWQARPERMLAYYHLDHLASDAASPAFRTTGKVTTWLGTIIGAILEARVYRHNFGSRMVSMRVKGTNGAIYHGRASYDWGQCVNLRLAKEQK